MADYVIAIDQGTTSSRAIVFDQNLAPVAIAQEEFPQHYPKPGWVEHDASDIWRTTRNTCSKAMKNAGVSAESIAAIGLTNQRETTLIWDRKTSQPIHNAIVWQDRRAAEFCARLKSDGLEPNVSRQTGLLLDPYFSATKIAWMLDNVEGARTAAEAGRLAFGTVDTFLLWRLTGGKVHATDATNASRTMLYDITRAAWSDELLEIFGIPRAILPEVHDCAGDFGVTEPGLFGAPIAIRGIAGDQQAATIGQACFSPGMMKATYGTGCFALLNTGDTPVHSRNRLLTTIAYQFDGKPTYALEGSIFVAGAAVQWLRDGLRIIDDAAQSGEMAQRADPAQNVILVPAFVGLGAPYWDSECRGAIYGLTRDTGREELARAALESVCFQTKDLLEAMRKDWGHTGDAVLRVDGGMAASGWAMQRLADFTGVVVERPKFLETTALGAGYLAGTAAGLYPSPEKFADAWALDRRFEVAMAAEERAVHYSGWQDAVERTLTRR